MQTVIDATQKETAIDEQQHSCEILICQRHQTLLRLLSSAATASTWWQVRKLYCLTTCLLNAIGLTPGGSSTVHIYTQTIHRTT